ncbi:peptidoglycan bridge formation glycyltransferase FemA/FemB family protein [Fusibacter bizertensis]|jgi:Uncharacterized protein involved in methicillin resistance|uniref:Peptidoglycan bridge formation glycyltransferase FemA/FemB family protein n=1 Tax=Fusibacter bizertensis TaxID=1488331 RepID=A0ABT6NBE2_9FIRM|nr:peptidoglycan bridge formation glycyltransferase FemA/FemB family protein [Fusibacter bizertensis]MDH8677737.1 peptidoglycan bridge formation glycyltransferase FemA/FemB family protein [Fusibacter bizertensis]
MPILDYTDSKAVEKYNRFVRESDYATATQDINWATIKTGWDSAQIYIEKEGEIVGAFSLVIKKMLGFSLLYATRGPVCDPYDLETLQLLINETKAFAKRKRAFVLRFDPEVKYDKALIESYEELGLKVRGRGVDKNALVQPIYNMILNLENDTEETLLARFSQKTRYNINLSRRKGVEVSYHTSDEALKIFYELYEIMSVRNRLVIRSYAYFQNMMRAFEGNIRIYLTKHEDDYLSGAIGIMYGDKLWYIYGASSNVKRNLMPNYLMQWEMIRWALENNITKYDFGGVFELDNEDGLYKFKEGFCREEGVTELIGEVDKIYNPIIYNLFTEVYPKLQKIKIKLLRKG